MEFVETPSFWYPHVDRAACTNFSTRTVELRPSERREILPFLSLISFPFPFSFLLSFPFSFPFLHEFFLFFSFSHPFFFSFFSSHFIFSSFLFSHSLLLIFLFLFLFRITIDRMVKGGNFLPFSFKPLVWWTIFFLISLFPFISSSHMWLIASHGIMQHMAQCEPFLSSEPHGS